MPSKLAEAPGQAAQGNLLVVGFTATYPNGETANNVYPFVCNAQPNAAASTNLLAQGYYWVAPFPGKLVSFGIVGISTPGVASNGAVCQLIKNGSTFGGGVNVNSFSGKAGYFPNFSFVAGDYWGIRYGCPNSGTVVLTGTLTVQLTLPN